MSVVRPFLALLVVNILLDLLAYGKPTAEKSTDNSAEEILTGVDFLTAFMNSAEEPSYSKSTTSAPSSTPSEPSETTDLLIPSGANPDYLAQKHANSDYLAQQGANLDYLAQQSRRANPRSRSLAYNAPAQHIRHVTAPTQPERNWSAPETDEQNYEIEEAVHVRTNGRAHGPSNQKVGYVVEGRDYRKYRVEERTPDGFIVGEYGVVSNNDGSLRGVRYTADGATNPRVIYNALMKFLAL